MEQRPDRKRLLVRDNCERPSAAYQVPVDELVQLMRRGARIPPAGTLPRRARLAGATPGLPLSGRREELDLLPRQDVSA